MPTIQAILKAILVIALPAVAFALGGRALERWSGRNAAGPAVGALCPDALVPLDRRLGYDAGAVDRYWQTVDLGVERRFLELDLLFPLLYGGALAAGLWMAWKLAGRPFGPGWVLGPVAIAVVADWTENTVQLVQLRGYLNCGGAALQPACIQVASIATTLKLLFVANSVLLLLALAVTAVLRARSAR